MRVLFNNCRGREHARLYGSEAFYDLERTGRQAKMATDVRPGTECVVATPVRDGAIEFGWFRVSRIRVMSLPEDSAASVRVFFGKRLRSETLPKADAIEAKRYSAYFNVNGHFKRLAAVVTP